jgi:hypothetical protein
LKVGGELSSCLVLPCIVIVANDIDVKRIGLFEGVVEFLVLVMVSCALC